MGILEKRVREVLSGHVADGALVQLFDYGTVARAGTGARAAAWQIVTGSSTAEHNAHDYVAVAVCQDTITFLPVQFKAGLLGMKFKPVKGTEAETFLRGQLQVAVGPVGDIGHGRQAVPVVFTLPDGSERQIEFYDNPQAWAPR